MAVHGGGSTAWLAVLVLLLALGVFLPLWNLGQAAMGKGGG